MALTKLGNYIEQIDITNENDFYNEDAVVGISTQKMMIPTKANLDGVKLTSYKLLPPNHFAFVPDTSRRGDKMSLCFNNTNNTFLVSSISVVFRVKNPSELNSDYLYMFYNRPEFDRFARFNSWGSARETFTWEDMCDIDIELPSLEIQKKYVDIYNAMVANQKSYEHGLDDLKLAMDSFYDKLKSCQTKKIAEVIKTRSNKNTDFSVPFSQLRGINESGEFTTTRDSIRADDIDKYLIVDNETYAVNFMCLGNFGKFYLAYNDFGEKYLVSPACNIFQLIDKSIDPYYFTYVLQRSEFQRKCVFYGDGNTRGGINIADFSNIEIPVPTKEEQTVISNLYRSFENRRKLNDKLKNQLKDICPTLIKGSVEEAKQEE